MAEKLPETDSERKESEPRRVGGVDGRTTETEADAGSDSTGSSKSNPLKQPMLQNSKLTTADLYPIIFSDFGMIVDVFKSTQ